LAEFIEFCSEEEMPEFIKCTKFSISETVYPAAKEVRDCDPENEA